MSIEPDRLKNGSSAFDPSIAMPRIRTLLLFGSVIAVNRLPSGRVIEYSNTFVVRETRLPLYFS